MRGSCRCRRTGHIRLGTDHQHKDILSQILYGAGTSLLVGFMAGAISLLLGTPIGLSARNYGKAVDELLMRLTDFFLVIPWFPLMIVLVAILGKSLWIVIVVIGITSWSPTARVVRAAVLSIKEKQYIERSKALGGRNFHIIRRHILPNVFPLIVATSILLVAEAIFSESFLGDRTVALDEFFVEPASSVLRSAEILVEIVIPDTGMTGSCYRKFGLRRSGALAVAGAAAAVRMEGGVVAEARVALSSCAPVVMRSRGAEGCLAGRKPTPEVLEEAGARAEAESRPRDSIRGSAEYRRHLAGVLTKRALRRAVEEGHV